MVIITKTKLIKFYDKDINAKEALLKWYHLALLSDWQDFHSIKNTFNSVNNVGNDRYVFNI